MQNNVDAKMFAMIVWSVWNLRNQTRTQQAHCNLDQLARLATERQQEFLAVQSPPKLKAPRQRAQWSPPTQDFIKINFDGAIFQEANKSGIGVVITNFSMGPFFKDSFSHPFHSCYPKPIQQWKLKRQLQQGPKSLLQNWISRKQFLREIQRS